MFLTNLFFPLLTFIYSFYPLVTQTLYIKSPNVNLLGTLLSFLKWNDYRMGVRNLDIYVPFHLNLFNAGVLINPYHIPLLNTVILLTSGAILTSSHCYLRVEKFLFSLLCLFVTLIFAVSFIICQIYEYCVAGFSINDGIFGSTFYMLTGFHGFHVLIGTIFLLVC